MGIKFDKWEDGHEYQMGRIPKGKVKFTKCLMKLGIKLEEYVAFQLSYNDNVSHQEISKVLGKPKSTITYWVSKVSRSMDKICSKNPPKRT